MRVYMSIFLTMLFLTTTCVLVAQGRHGKKQLSTVETVIEDSNTLAAFVEFYPQPTVNFTYIRNNYSAALDSVEILNSDGDLVAELPGIASGSYTAIDLHGYVAGTYTLKIKSADGLVLYHNLEVGQPN